MADLPLKLGLLITTFTVASGLLDSLAFTYASTMWQGGRIVWADAVKSAVSFALGIGLYWCAVRYLSQAGVVMPEIQTLIWFSVTIVGVAVLGGRFPSWPVLDQVIALNVLLSMGFLIARTAEV